MDCDCLPGSGRGRVELEALRLAVEQEGPEAVGDGVVGEKLQVELVELEGAGKLVDALVDSVEELDEDGREIGLVVAVCGVVVAPLEAVAEREPLALDEEREAVEGAVVGVEEQLGERGDLGGQVPALLQRH